MTQSFPAPPPPEAIAAAVAAAEAAPQMGEVFAAPETTEAKKYNKGAVKPGKSASTGKGDGRLTAGGKSRNRGKPH